LTQNAPQHLHGQIKSIMPGHRNSQMRFCSVPELCVASGLMMNKETGAL
jgi:hypothetical protein